MTNRRVAAGIAGAILAVIPVAAAAQTPLRIGVEATTDERRRGLGWSDGRASVSADAVLAIGAAEASARVAALRDADRHAGAEAVADLGLAYGWELSGLRLTLRGIGHLFSGAALGMDYGEIGGTGTYSLGPARIFAGAVYAPDQRAIGGSNLYLHTGADIGIPATPFTLSASIGRSSGHADDPARAARLRPVGRYTDWRIGAEHVTGALTLAIDYIGNDIDRGRIVDSIGDARHSGDKLVARARITF